LFTHDCEQCVFLGNHKVPTKDFGQEHITERITVRVEIYDLYFCEKGIPSYAWPTVIARYGNEGPEYKSGMALAPYDPALALALYIARERELVQGRKADV
jgi:hypothetical protein